jgi:hypothetical protein
MSEKSYLLQVRRIHEGRMENNFEVLAKAAREIPVTVEELRLKDENFQQAQNLRN